MIASKITNEGTVKSVLLDAPDHAVAELADGRFQVTLSYPNGCVVTHVCDAYTMQERLAATPGFAKVSIDGMKARVPAGVKPIAEVVVDPIIDHAVLK